MIGSLLTSLATGVQPEREIALVSEGLETDSGLRAILFAGNAMANDD